jgi:uncharacterized protein (DUF1697 family)
MRNAKIAFLRGINVGGHKKFPKMTQLKMLEDLGFSNAKVYLHTGNWIFSSEETGTKISEKISAAIMQTYGWEVPVLIFNASEIEGILANCPFSEEKKVKSYFILLKNSPIAEKISKVEKVTYPDEEFHITEHCVYFYPAKGVGKSKMGTNFFENKLNVVATARNYNTIVKIIALFS